MTNKIPKIISFIVLIAFGTSLGLFFGYVSSHSCFVLFRKNITLAEDVVFDNEYTTHIYGGPVVISKGTKGSITDGADYRSDDCGEEYIHAFFTLSDGEGTDVLISTGMPSDLKPDLSIDISKIESSQEVLSEYKQSREDLRTRIRNTRITGALIGFAVPVVITIIFLVVNKKRSGASD